MEPLLVIGLGGIGSLIAQSAQKRMRKDPAARRQIDEGVVQFISIDTAKKCWAPDLATTYVDLEPGFRGPVAIDDLRKHTFFRNAWPDGFEPSNVMEGSQVRALGRLAYLRKVLLRDPAAFRDRIDAAYQSALTFWAAPATGSAARRSLTIAICGSATGGTCSGTLIDIAFAIRSYTRAKAGIEPYVFAFLLDPEAVSLVKAAAADERRLNANYVALMLELEYWMNSTWGDKRSNAAARYDVQYPESSRMAPFNAPHDGRAESPIDLTFHVCGTFQDGSVLPTGRYEPLVDLAGEALYTMSRTNAVAGLTAFAQGASNLEPGANGMMQRHGSFGAIALRVPTEKIGGYLSLARAATALDGMLADADEKIAAERADTFVNQARLRAEQDDIASFFDRSDPNLPDDLQSPVDLVLSFEKDDWQSLLVEWRTKFDGWKRTLEARSETHRGVEAKKILHDNSQSLRMILANAAADHGTTMASVLATAIRTRLEHERTEIAAKIAGFERDLDAEGACGHTESKRRQTAIDKAFRSWLHRGLRDELESFTSFLTEEMNTARELIFHRAAVKLINDVVDDTRRWSEAYVWVGNNCVRTARALLATVEQSQTRGKLKRELPEYLNFSVGAMAGDFALEFDVLGARDVVDEMIAPIATPGRAEDIQVAVRQEIVTDSARGVQTVAQRMHDAMRAKDADDHTAFAQLEEEARSNRLATSLLNVSREAGLRLCKDFLDSLTLDKALFYEAEFVLRRQRKWSSYFDTDSAESLVRVVNEGTHEDAQKRVIELRLDIFRRKAVIAAQQATVRGATGNPAHKVQILSGNGAMNPLAWNTLATLAQVQYDDRQTEDDVTATAEWKAMLLLTTVAYGFELWWLSSFHKALPSYHSWLAQYDTGTYPVHTDKRYRNAWPLYLPLLPAQQEALVALAMAEASNLMKKSADVFTVNGGETDEDLTLGRSYADVVERVLHDDAARLRILKARSIVDARLEREAYPALAQAKLLKDAALKIKKHVEEAPDNQKRHVRGVHHAVTTYADRFSGLESKRLRAEELARDAANGPGDMHMPIKDRSEPSENVD